jgi:LAO/AO transport system kinase
MARTQDAVSVHELVRGVLAQDRRALARAITLVESTRPQDVAASEAVLTELLPRSGHAMRIGISGAPGVGKSTFIESLGAHVTGKGRRVAVLAVDPTSPRSGGSIMGDKTRMPELARNPHAFIRPSPSGVALGGVARRTREAIIVVEAAGYDVVIVETVGVGQSETAVADMTDFFVLLIGPAAGDYLQGIKRGVMEFADLILITKSDGELEAAAVRAAADYQAALHLVRPKYPEITPVVHRVSALRGQGVAEAWHVMESGFASLKASGHLPRLRADQARRWLWDEIHAALLTAVRTDPKTATTAKQIEASVEAGKELPPVAACRFVQSLRRA